MNGRAPLPRKLSPFLVQTVCTLLEPAGEVVLQVGCVVPAFVHTQRRLWWPPVRRWSLIVFVCRPSTSICAPSYHQCAGPPCLARLSSSMR